VSLVLNLVPQRCMVPSMGNRLTAAAIERRQSLARRPRR
jgi:hypothetical protein